jgi:O-antigen/teichoic acid export membrane protein
MRLGQTSAIFFTSKLLASVVGFVATLYIAKELGSATLGTYTLLVAVLIWLKTLAGSGINYSLKKRLSEVTGGGWVLGASFVLQTTAYILVVAVVLSLRGQINGYLGFDGSWLLVIALAAALGFGFVNATLQGEKKVHIGALLQLVDRVVRSSIQLAVVFLGVLGGGVAGLVWGYVAGIVVAGLAGIVLISTRPAVPTREELANLAEFTQYSWLTSIEQRALSSMDTIVLGVFVAPNLIGYYEVAWNLASLLAIFGTSIAQSLFPTISELNSEGKRDEVGELVTDSLAYTGLFLIPGLFGSVLIGDLLLRIYGSPFQQATTVLVVLIVARLIYAYEAQFVSTLNAINHPELAFRVNIAFVLANIVLNVLLVWAFGWLGAAVGTASAAAIGLVAGFRALRQVIWFAVPWGELARQASSAMAMIVALIPLRTLLSGATTPIIDVLLLVGAGAGVYFGTLLGVSARFRTTVQNNAPL